MNLMLAMAEEEENEDGPRLYSRGYKNRTPIDDVAPQQLDVHARLVRWGRWAGSRGSSSSAPFADGLYSGRGGTPASTAPMSADPQIMAIERVVIRMPMQHADSLRMLYVQRLTPTTICKAKHLRYEDWPKWIFDCRAMVVNLLRRHGR